MMETTLNKLKTINFDNIPSSDVDKLLKYLNKTEPDDEPLSMSTILEAIGFHSALRCLRAVYGFEKEKLLLNYTYAKEVEHLMPAESRKSLNVLKKYTEGSATREDVTLAYESAAAVARSCVDGDWLTNAAANVAATAFFGCDTNEVAYEVATICVALGGIVPKQKQENQLREILTLKV